jgi:transcriptional regulator of acetoin/glycerol metabolism
VISATNADLRAMIRAGAFREDLYYRLNTIEIHVPPLTQRTDDILALAEAFLAPGKRLTADARAALRAHTWPGNVRELKNALQRAALLAAGDTISAADLALTSPSPAGADEPDRDAIEAALRRAGGVVAQAAAELGLSRQALYRRMDKLSIPRE